MLFILITIPFMLLAIAIAVLPVLLVSISESRLDNARRPASRFEAPGDAHARLEPVYEARSPEAA